MLANRAVPNTIMTGGKSLSPEGHSNGLSAP